MLVRLALRIAGVEALKGKTLVGDNVNDSHIGAIDIAADGAVRTDQEKPFITVYSDDSRADDATLRDLRQNGHLDFVLEFGVTAAMTETDPDTGVTTVIGIGVPATDAALELSLDVTSRQIVNALTDPDNAWAERWRKLSNSVVKIEQRRAANTADGARLAARQLRITLDAKPDPVFGQPLTGMWPDIRAAIANARPELTGTLDALFGAAGTEVTFAVLRRARGQTAGEAERLGYAPAYPAAPDAVIDSDKIEVAGDVDPA